MNRTGVAALIAAGIVGIVGGTVSAVVRGEPSAGPRAPVTATPSTGTPQARLLYAGDKVIHDGLSTVRYQAPFDTPDRLVRSSTGYLVSHSTSPDDPSSRIYSVLRDGSTTVVADVLGGWDLNADRDRIVGTGLESRQVTVWGLDGKEIRSGKRFANSATPVWSGETVLISEHVEQEATPFWRMSTWNPATGAVRATRNMGMLDLTASVDGALLSGAVNLEGISGDEANPCLRVASAPGSPDVQWKTCDWRANGQTTVFSPAGSRVVAIPSESDGFGPGEFATFPAGAGPAGGQTSFLAPEWTLGAVWLDEEHLVVTSKTDADLDSDTGTVLRQCDLQGTCRVVASRDKGELVVGEQG